MGKPKAEAGKRLEGEDCNGSGVVYTCPDGGVITCKVRDEGTPKESRDQFFICMEPAGAESVTMGMSASAVWTVSMVLNVLRENPEVDRIVRGRIMVEVLGSLGRVSEAGRDEEAESRFDKTIGKGRAH